MSTNAAQQQNQVIKTTPILISFLIAGFIGLFSETALNMALGDLIQEFNVSSFHCSMADNGLSINIGDISSCFGSLNSVVQYSSIIYCLIGIFYYWNAHCSNCTRFRYIDVARVIQAIGTGLLLPLMFNTILLIFPIHKRGATMGLMGLVIMFAPAIGPTSFRFDY